MTHELPILDRTRCIGCGECVQLCPTECLRMLEAEPLLVRPRDCIACSVCALICPTEAIRVERPTPECSSE